MNDPYFLAIAILGGLLVIGALVLAIVLRRYTRLRLELPDMLRDARRDAVTRSAAVTRGQTLEHLVPFMDDFGYRPRDARFLGSPIDFVVFDGLGETDVREIVFVEVKTGRSRLSARERAVRKAVLEGRVRWRELRA